MNRGVLWLWLAAAALVGVASWLTGLDAPGPTPHAGSLSSRIDPMTTSGTSTGEASQRSVPSRAEVEPSARGEAAVTGLAGFVDLVLDVRDEGDRPVEGVELEVRGPGSDERRDRLRSGADGLARLRVAAVRGSIVGRLTTGGVTPERATPVRDTHRPEPGPRGSREGGVALEVDLRVEVVSDHRVSRVDAPSARRGPRPAAGIWIDTRGGRGWSIRALEGDEVRLELRVLRGRVTGRLASVRPFAPDDRPAIRILARAPAPAPVADPRPTSPGLDTAGEGAVETWTEEAAVRAADGRFELDGLAAGEKALFAVASCASASGEAATAFLFYRHRFTLPPGADLDLGRIDPLVGEASSLTVALRGPGGALSPRDVFGVATLRAVLHVRPDGLDTQDPWFAARDAWGAQVLDVPLGRPVELHGLPPGRWLLSASAGFHELGSWPPPAAGLEVDEGEAVAAEAPFRDLELAMAVRRTTPVRLRLLPPPGTPPFRATVVLLHDGGAHREVRLDPDARGGWERDLSLPAGRWRIAAHPDPLAGPLADHLTNPRSDPLAPGPAAPLAGLAEVEVAGETPVEVRVALRAGAGVVGVARPRQVLGFGLPGWDDREGRPVPLLKARATEDGRFVLPGVPPGVHLVPAGAGFRGFVAPPAGRIAEVDVR